MSLSEIEDGVLTPVAVQLAAGSAATSVNHSPACLVCNT
jgi:hypothetical protein